MAKRKKKQQRSTGGSRTPLARLTVSELQLELRRRERGTNSLHRKRAKLLEKLAAIDEQIRAAGGTVEGRPSRSGTGRTRPRNDTNLLEALRAALKDKTMSIAEAAEAVLKSGYQSSAANFKLMVNANLIKKKFFKRVERGRYTAA